MRVGSYSWRKILRSSSAGFSLVELLTVVAIISVLAAVLFPVLITVKERARTHECLSNMYQIGVAINCYVDDNNSRMPAAAPLGSPDYWKYYNSKTIQEVLFSYVRNVVAKQVRGNRTYYLSRTIFGCPSDFGIPREDPFFGGTDERFGIVPDEPVWKFTGSSYEYYASDQLDYLSDEYHPVVKPWTGLSPERYTPYGKVRVGAPFSAIVRPQYKAILGEVYYWHVGDRLPDGRLAARNTLFADGHARRVRGVIHLGARIQQLRHWEP